MNTLIGYCLLFVGLMAVCVSFWSIDSKLRKVFGETSKSDLSTSTSHTVEIKRTNKSSNVDNAVLSRIQRGRVAWLLSFPNSGTTYTLANTAKMCNATIATNYGQENVLPAHAYDINGDSGPYVTSYTEPMSPYVLTKTHCTSYCDACKIFIVNVDEFEKGCCTSHLYRSPALQSTYSMMIPQRAIHLIRDPFDNLVARLHLGVRGRKKGGWRSDQLVNYTSSKEGYHAWCRGVIDKANKPWTELSELIPDHVKQLMKDLPCASEWYRYVQWHNLAIEVTKRRQLPTHILYYEDYTSDYNATVKALYKFLELEIVRDPEPFVPGKTYRSYFYGWEMKMARRLVEAMASSECWDRLKRYF